MIHFSQSSALLSVWTLTLTSLLAAPLHAIPFSKKSPTYQPRPYTVNIDPLVIEEIRTKVSTFRSSPDINTPPWFDGPAASEIASFAEYWIDEYDWPATQASINANFSHFYTTVPPPGGHYNEPVDLHFIHQRSEREDAIPILLLHGWPSTSLEWQNIIPGLVKPDNSSQPAFHVVAPDIPGFGFSPALTGSRVNVSRTEYATIFASLMQQLGYDRYVLYSTDLGTVVALGLVVDYKAHIINHVTDFYIALPTDADQARFQANQTSPEETKYISASNAFFNQHSGYSAIHSTYPLTIAYALNDSPLGFLAWLYHISQTVNDRQYTPDELITVVLLLYVPGVYNNIRSYKELFSHTSFIPAENFTVPTSVLQYGGYTHYPELDGWASPVS